MLTLRDREIMEAFLYTRKGILILTLGLECLSGAGSQILRFMYCANSGYIKYHVTSSLVRHQNANESGVCYQNETLFSI